MAFVSKNLGLIKAIHVGVNPPTNIKMIWFNENLGNHFAYNQNTSAWEPIVGSVSGFLTLTDTPSNYMGQAGKVVKVNLSENGLEFDDDEVGAVDSVNGEIGDVILDADDIDDSITTNKFVNSAQISLINNSLQPNDNISELINDVGYLTFIPSTYLESGDNISELANDSGFITGLDWIGISGNQSDINLSGFTNDSGFITSFESIYSGNGTIPSSVVSTITDNFTLSGGNLNIKSDIFVASTGVIDINGELIDSPTFNLSALYDSDPTAGITASLTNFTLQHHVTAGGATPTSYASFSINEEEKMRLTSSGNLGVNETNPTSSIQVKGSIYIDSNSTANNRLGFGDFVGRCEIYYDEATTFQFIFETNNAGYNFQRSNITKLLIQNAANTHIGVGNYSPGSVTSALQVKGNGTAAGLALRVENSTLTRLFEVKDNGILSAPNLPTYADEAAAIAGSLSQGDLYQTATGEIRIKL